MPLVYVPDHPFDSPSSSYAPVAPVDRLAARNHAFLAELAQSLDGLYPRTGFASPVGTAYHHQQQQQQRRRLEHKQAEAALLQALDDQRTRRAREARLRRIAHERADRQRRIVEACEKQQAYLQAVEQQHAHRQRILQRQAAHEQRRRRLAAMHHQRAVHHHRQHQQHRQTLEASLDPLEAFLQHFGQAVEAPLRQQPKRKPSPSPESEAEEEDEASEVDERLALEQAFDQMLVGACTRPASSASPAPERSSTTPPPAAEEPAGLGLTTADLPRVSSPPAPPVDGVDDEDVRSARSSSTTSTSRGRKAYVEDASDDDE